MAEIENLIRILATLLGAVTLLAPTVSVLFLSHRAKGRSSGRGTGFRSGLGVLIMTIGFVAAGVLLWKPLPIHVTDQFSFGLALIGSIFYFGGVGLYLWGLATIRSQFGVSSVFGAELYQEHKLVTNGPFAIIRHPMYAGVLLAAIGALLIFRTWAMAVFMPMSLAVLARAGREEKLLELEFGHEWRSYKAKVHKWIPGFK